MNTYEPTGDWVLALALSIATLATLAIVCLDRHETRRDRRQDRAEKRCVAADRHPVQPRRRTPAARCPKCQFLVAYERHPQGRDDALALHAAYECANRPAVRRHHQ